MPCSIRNTSHFPNVILTINQRIRNAINSVSQMRGLSHI